MGGTGKIALLTGANPVREALQAGVGLDRVHVLRGAGGARLQELIDLCRQRAVPVRFETRQALDRLAGGRPHQGVAAVRTSHQYADLEAILPDARLLVVLDGVEDPHNLGAIIRTAHAAGAAAVLVPERRAAPITDAVARAASGALAYLPVVRVPNLNRVLETLKQRGFWIYGLDQRGEAEYDTTEYNIPSALILGGEGKGLHEQVRKNCDVLVRIPMAGKIASLNVSVAAGIALFEWKRRCGAGD